jgi:hypothetical protein
MNRVIATQPNAKATAEMVQKLRGAALQIQATIENLEKHPVHTIGEDSPPSSGISLAPAAGGIGDMVLLVWGKENFFKCVDVLSKP